MNLMDLLKQYADSPTDTHADFDTVARQVPPDVLGSGIAQALRSDQTPSFGNMIGSLFGGSSPQQRAGLLSELIRAAGPTVLASLGGGALGKLVQGMKGGSSAQSTQLSPEDASKVTPDELTQIASGAEKADPGIIDKIGAFYGQHPDVFKAVGGLAMAIAMGHIAKQMKQ
ncbi:MAG: hypothetical protein ABI434_16460 [Burkholderiaceae bacterium]